ncbi:MAG: 16S rRNA (uracil(1498)-N(3))-methyltransferase [Bacteroidales bacterium]
MHLFYHPDAGFSSSFTFNKEESGHIAKVLRLKPGDTIHLTNGLGYFYPAEIIEANPNKVRINILEEHHQPRRDFFVHIALAPTKNIKRTEWFVEKAVEIGIEKISFFHSRHSERNIIKPERIKKVAIAAMKQSQKAYLPEISDMLNIQDILSNAGESHKWIAHCNNNLKRTQIHTASSAESHLILIGPEGGFHINEIEKAEKHKFNSIELSPYRLRTETAALTACQWLNIHYFKKCNSDIANQNNG